MEPFISVMVNYVVRDGMNSRTGTRMVQFESIAALEAWLATLDSTPGFSSDTIYDLPGPILT